jgi:transposase-like protein
MPEKKSTPIETGNATEEIRGIMERIAREGAQKVFQAALEAEVEDHLARYEYLRDGDGRKAVVSNGHEKELLAVRDGSRESEQSWKELLLELKDRELEIDPKLAIADGASGFWKALPQVYPSTRPQRCRVHKIVNVLDKPPSRTGVLPLYIGNEIAS